MCEESDDGMKPGCSDPNVQTRRFSVVTAAARDEQKLVRNHRSVGVNVNLNSVKNPHGCSVRTHPPWICCWDSSDLSDQLLDPPAVLQSVARPGDHENLNWQRITAKVWFNCGLQKNYRQTKDFSFLQRMHVTLPFVAEIKGDRACKIYIFSH